MNCEELSFGRGAEYEPRGWVARIHKETLEQGSPETIQKLVFVKSVGVWEKPNKSWSRSDKLVMKPQISIPKPGPPTCSR